MNSNLILIKGAGDLATGTAQRLAISGFPVVMLEVKQPTVIRRPVAFAEVVFQDVCSIEGVNAKLVDSPWEVDGIVKAGNVAVLVDPHWSAISLLKPIAVIDAIIAKRNLGTSKSEAPIVIGLGPGFTAGEDVHAVVETQRGHDLGKVFFSGSAAPNTGIPGEIGGYSTERLLRSPAEGIFQEIREIGDLVIAGDLVAMVGDTPIHAPITGVLRGLLRSGISVPPGFKVGDIDPRCTLENCFTISDKARSVAGGVLEALLHLLNKEGNLWMPSSNQHFRTSVRTI